MSLTRSDDPKVLFSDDELRCKKTGRVVLATGFGKKLVELRESYGHPMIVTSCCRSQAYNKAISGHPRSLHIYNGNAHGLNGTAAIDIKMPLVSLRWQLLGLAKEQGWAVGVAREFLHLDLRILAGLTPTVFGY